eukprot:TRINITY_DN65223_c0_g1_i2.p1 TRINITY_DN65223_c0_g1~~TRINITY_DN65223_c0_g1_i2.p1  ORF type:complete len:101 (+),score=0.11 TRINITY_DN65223_c0_g1_i2:47-304(+)
MTVSNRMINTAHVEWGPASRNRGSSNRPPFTIPHPTRVVSPGELTSFVDLPWLQTTMGDVTRHLSERPCQGSLGACEMDNVDASC